MSASNVVAIDSARQWETPVTEGREDTGTAGIRAGQVIKVARVLGNMRAPVSGQELRPRDLYPDAGADSSVATALDLVERTKACLEAARELDPQREFFEFDEHMITARALLNRAFRFRGISDGYGALVNALNWALANRGPASPSKKQLGAMIEAAERLIRGPFIHFDTAMAIMDELESLELDIEPPALDLLTSDLND